MNPWLQHFPARDDTALSLFCMPYAGGGASVFRRWATALPGAAVVGVQLPGRENRMGEPLATDLVTVAEAIATAIAPHTTRRYALFGHSMGALLAFETARALRRMGRPAPSQLLCGGARAPRFPRDPALLDISTDAGLRERLLSLGGTPAEILDHAELMALIAPVIRADFALVRTYRYTPEAPLGMPLFVLGGLEDGDVPRADLQAWLSETTGPGQVSLFPGGHMFIQTGRAAVLAAVAKALGLDALE